MHFFFFNLFINIFHRGVVGVIIYFIFSKTEAIGRYFKKMLMFSERKSEKFYSFVNFF